MTLRPTLSQAKCSENVLVVLIPLGEGEREVAASLRADGGIFIKGDVYHGFE